MRHETKTLVEDQLITNVIHTDVDDLPMFEEVICETGSFPVLRLVACDGALVDADPRD